MPFGFESGRAGNVPRVDPRFIHTVLLWNGVRATKGPDSLSLRYVCFAREVPIRISYE